MKTLRQLAVGAFAILIIATVLEKWSFLLWPVAPIFAGFMLLLAGLAKICQDSYVGPRD